MTMNRDIVEVFFQTILEARALLMTQQKREMEYSCMDLYAAYYQET